MTNVVDFMKNLKVETRSPSKVKELDWEHGFMIDNGLYFLEDCLGNLKSFKKQELKNEKYFDARFAWSFLLEDPINNEYWTMRFSGIQDGQFVWSCINHEEIRKDWVKSKSFAFPYSYLKSPLHRQKMATWIICETFSPILGREQVDKFLSEKSIYNI